MSVSKRRTLRHVQRLQRYIKELMSFPVPNLAANSEVPL